MTDSFDASEINNWSDTADAEHRLPQLIRRLVMDTVPESQLRIDMPSGSSVRFPGWDGLLEVGRGNAWVPSGDSGWEFSCDKAVMSKANGDYKKRTGDPLDLDKATATFVFLTSRRWNGKRKWARERREEGEWRDVRAYDADDLVAWLEQSPEIMNWFTSVIRRSPYDHQAVNRIERRQLETNDKVTAGFADMRLELRTMITSLATQAESPDSDPLQDSEQRRLSGRIDGARDLVQQGLIGAARKQLEQIQGEADELPDTLRFRLLTNLAVCALGENRFDEAAFLLNEAHRLQPENQTGITNAALAAQLQKNPNRASELARKALAMEPHDSNAAATLILALWDMGEREQLEEFVTSEEWIAQVQASASALARVRMQQARYEDAITVYRSLVDTYPDDAHAHLGLSKCLLTYAQVDRVPVGYRNESLTMLCDAEAQADRAMVLLRPTQLDALCHEALLLRSGARVLLGKIDEAMRDVDVVLGDAPEHPVAVLHKGLMLLEKGLPAEARMLLESIQDPQMQTNSLLPRADACLESDDATAAIALLKGTFNLDPPGREDLGRAELLLRAEAVAGAGDSIGPALEAAIERHPDDPGLFFLAAVRSSLQGDTEASAADLTKAIELTDSPHRQVLQTELGRLYVSMKRYVDAAEQFGQACGDNPSHPAAVQMLLALFNSRQYRKALDLARKVREVDGPPPRVVIDIEAIILGYVGDSRNAVLRHRELCGREDSTPEDRVKLALAQFRCGERDAALVTIRDIDVSELGHDPQPLMKLAQMKRLLGATDYIHDAYLSRRYGLNDPDAHMGYFRLFLGKEEEWEEPVVAGPGCSVRIKSDEREEWWQVLEDGDEPHGLRELSPDDELAQRLLGRRVGDVVVLRQGLGELSYEITALQSKYVRAYQETIQEFSTRFPDNMSLLRFKPDNDFTQLFQSIELRDQHVSNVEGLYKSRRLPFASFCSHIGSSTIEVWPEYTAQSTKRLHFGSGSEQETSEAGEQLRDADVIVLDIVALLTVHRLGLAEPLRTRFSRVTIPQHVFDEIQNVVYQMRTDRAPIGHVGKDEDGQYTGTDITEQNWIERQAYADSVLELADSLERIAAYPMLAANEPEKAINALTLAGAGAVYSGDEQSDVRPVLVSDDHLQSVVARSLGLGVGNSQALLVELLRSDVITAEEYSSWIEQLVLMNYWFVRVGADDILRRLEANGYQTTLGTQAMLRTLWGPDCIEDNAASVGAEVVASLAKKPLIHEHLELLLLSVVAAIRHGRQTNQVLLKFKNKIAARLVLLPIQCDRILRTVDLYMRT